jgi:hypothetical protein
MAETVAKVKQFPPHQMLLVQAVCKAVLVRRVTKAKQEPQAQMAQMDLPEQMDLQELKATPVQLDRLVLLVPLEVLVVVAVHRVRPVPRVRQEPLVR